MSKGRVLAIIPARYQSTRFPGKVIAELCGMPMVQWVYDKAKQTRSVDEVWVATDHSAVEDALSPFLTRVVQTPSNCVSGTERAWSAYKAIRSEFDIILNIQADEPLISPEDIEKVISAFDRPETQIASLFRRMDQDEDPNDSNIVKVVLKRNNDALYFSRSRIPFDRDQSAEGNDFFAHVGIYGFKTSVLEEIMTQSNSSYLEGREMLEQLNWLEHGYQIKMARTEHKPRGVDTPEQLEAIIRDVKENPSIIK